MHGFYITNYMETDRTGPGGGGPAETEASVGLFAAAERVQWIEGKRTAFFGEIAALLTSA